MSFGWLGVFREGSWREFRRFLLHEKRDAPKRIAVINAELERIGEVSIIYASTEVAEGDVQATETRLGLVVTSGTSLHKLMQAYIAQGGNPFDISLFLQPESTLILNRDGVTVRQENFPNSGVVAPKSVEFSSQFGAEDGGWLPLNKYLPSRLGGRAVVWDKTVAIVEAVDSMRRWSRQEIRHKRNNMEARILKMVDLREQLLFERDTLIEQAVGGTLSGVRFRREYHTQGRRIQNLINRIDSVFYASDDSGRLSFDIENPESRVTGRYQTLLANVADGSENWTAL